MHLKHLDLQLLRALVAVADSETFAAAAIRTFKTQSAVTQQMRRLEDQVGTALFEKQGRNKRLTPDGHRLLDYARHMLAINDEALRNLKEGSLVGSLRIGAPPDVADTILPQLLSHIARSSPSLQVEIDINRSPLVLEQLLAGKIDLGVSTRSDPSLDGVVLRTAPTVWICSADYVHKPSEILPLVLADGQSLFRRLAVEVLEKERIRWRPAYVATSLTGIKAAIRAGLGITARSIELLTNDMRILGEKDQLPRLPDVTYYLWMRRDAINTRTRQVFELLKANLGLRNGA